MSPGSWVNWFIIFMVNIQAETEFYATGFDSNPFSTDWIIDEEGKGVEWTNTYSGFNGGYCMELEGDAIVSSTIPTTGYHTIRIEIDIDRSDDLSSTEGCYVGYTTSSTSWTDIKLVSESTGKLLNTGFNVPNTNSYDNQASFQLRFMNSASDPGDSCYYDNLHVFGIPYTSSPTKQPSKIPSKSPTSKAPTPVPTYNPSNIPSNIPTLRPTNDPSKSPTIQPTLYPTDNPTRSPTVSPSESPTHLPSKEPTLIPTPVPSSHPTKEPSSNPSMTPSSDPTREPTQQSSLLTSMTPSSDPSAEPTQYPSDNPSISVTAAPSKRPTVEPHLRVDTPTIAQDGSVEGILPVSNGPTAASYIDEEPETGIATTAELLIGIMGSTIITLCIFICCLLLCLRRRKKTKIEKISELHGG